MDGPQWLTIEQRIQAKGKGAIKSCSDVFALIWNPVFQTKHSDDFISLIKVSHVFIVPGLVKVIHLGLC